MRSLTFFKAHPPTSVLAALPLARLNFETAFLVWNLASVPMVFPSLWLVGRGLRICFPPGRIKMYNARYAGPNPPCSSPAFDKGILISILPFVEQAPTYDAINQSLTIHGAENQTVHLVSIAIYACPDDASAGVPRDLYADALVPYGLPDPPGQRQQMVFTSYAGSLGTFPVVALPLSGEGCKVHPDQYVQSNGCFNDVSPIQFGSITDGLANTIFLAEKATSLLRELGGVDGTAYERRGWYVTGNWGDTLFTTYYPPNAFKRLPPAAILARSISASSLHPAGLNLSMADGSVRLIRDTVSSWPTDGPLGDPAGIVRTRPFPYGWFQDVPPMGIWQTLSTRAGGEIISADY